MLHDYAPFRVFLETLIFRVFRRSLTANGQLLHRALSELDRRGIERFQLLHNPCLERGPLEKKTRRADDGAGGASRHGARGLRRQARLPRWPH